MNSASALREVLAGISSQKYPETKRFGDALAEYLSIEGEDAEFYASLHCSRLARALRNDIEGLDISTDEKRYLTKFLSPFLSLQSPGIYGQALKQANQGFLSGDSVNNLYVLSATLSGHVKSIDIQEECADIIKIIDKTREELSKTSIDEQLRKEIDKRLNYLSSALSHYRFFGASGVSEALSMLMGSIAVRMDASEKEENKKFIDGVGDLFEHVSGVLRRYREASDNVSLIFDQGQKLIEFVRGASGG